MEREKRGRDPYRAGRPIHAPKHARPHKMGDEARPKTKAIGAARPSATRIVTMASALASAGSSNVGNPEARAMR